MKTKLTGMILFGIFVYLAFPSFGMGAIIMTNDGNSMNCLVDDEQHIKIKTSKGESVFKFKDILWMAGKDNKRIRLSGKSQSMTGQMISGIAEDKKQIKVEESGRTIFLSAENIIFFYKQDIDLKNIRELELEEYNGTHRWIASENKDSQKLKIKLLPENWGGNIKISNPLYAKKASSRSNFKIEFYTETDNPSLYKDMGLYLLFKVHSFGNGSSSSVSALPFKKKGDLLKHNNSALYPNPFYISFGGVEYFGNGHFLLYITSDYYDHKEVLGEGNLTISETLSNVLELPITVVKNKK